MALPVLRLGGVFGVLGVPFVFIFVSEPLLSSFFDKPFESFSLFSRQFSSSSLLSSILLFIFLSCLMGESFVSSLLLESGELHHRRKGFAISKFIQSLMQKRHLKDV